MKMNFPRLIIIFLWASLFLILATGCGDDNPVNPGSDVEAPPGWYSLFSKPQSNTLNDVHMINPFTAVAVGDGGTIMRSTSGGSNWNIIRSSNRFERLNCVSIAENFGLAGGDNGTLLISRNSGKTWVDSPPPPTDAHIYGVHVVDEMTATIVGQFGLIMRTNDGGQSWIDQSAFDPTLIDVSFFNADVGIAISSNRTVLWTTDGGSNWLPNNLPREARPYSVVMTSRTSAFISGSSPDIEKFEGERGTVYSTTDSGASWHPFKTTSYSAFRFLAMSSSSTGYTGSYNQIYKTGDGGQSWVRLPDPQMGLLGLSCSGEAAVLAVGVSGGITNSTDGGATWTRRSQTFHPEVDYPQLNSLWFFNSEVGLVGTTSDGVFRTINGGRSWTQTNADRQILFFHFFDETTGLASNHQEQGIFRTTDGGLTWTNIPVGTWLFYVHFADSRVGLGTGSSGTVRRSTDGGLTWTAPVISPATYQLGKPFLVTPEIVLIIGQNGNFFRSTNGGITSWDRIDIGNCIPVDIDFNADRSSGIVVGHTPTGDAGTIFRSIDAGATWQDHGCGSTPLSAVHFADAQTAYAVGQAGEILKSTDGGINWVEQESPSADSLNDVFFTSPTSGMAVGQGGTILRTDFGGE